MPINNEYKCVADLKNKTKTSTTLHQENNWDDSNPVNVTKS